VGAKQCRLVQHVRSVAAMYTAHPQAQKLAIVVAQSLFLTRSPRLSCAILQPPNPVCCDLPQAALGQAKAPALPVPTITTITTATSALPALALDTTAGFGGPSSASTTAPLRPRVVPLLETSTFAKESLRGLNSPRSRLPRLGGAQTAQAGGLGNASPRAFLPSAPGTPTRAQRVLKFLKDAPYMGEMPLRIGAVQAVVGVPAVR
jgi:hypothetical protein